MLIYDLFPPIAQLVEQLPFKERVPGSNPGGRINNLWPIAKWAKSMRLAGLLPKDREPASVAKKSNPRDEQPVCPDAHL